MVVGLIGTFEAEGGQRTMAEDECADALRRYWAAVKEAEATIAPFFTDGSSPSGEQRAIIAHVVHHVRVAEDAYFTALKTAGRAIPQPIWRAEQH
jgi:hypothetical protein